MLAGTFVLIAAALLLPLLDRRHASLAFFLAATFIPPTVFLAVGPLHFYPFRVMVISGLVRLLVRSERPLLFPQALDKLVSVFGLICIASGVFHKHPIDALVYRSAMTLDWVGTYFLFRSWIQSWDDVQVYIRSLVIVMIPFAVTMLYEKATGHNFFAWFGGMRSEAAIRDGKVRASGPFVNYITAGTIGSVCLALAVSLRRDSENRSLARLGIASCLAIAYASASSSPLVTCGAGLLGVWLWKYRVHLRTIIWTTIAVLFVGHLVKSRPIWFIMDDIDLVGGSTGWYRAMLISRAIEFFHEWWLVGTDYTRHWMATGTASSPDMCDLVNHYIWLGVMGGLPLMLSFIWILRECFRQISKTCKLLPDSATDIRYKLWCLGSCLFANCVTFISMAYYDEAGAFLYSLFGVIGSGCLALLSETPDAAFGNEPFPGAPSEEEAEFDATVSVPMQ